MDQLLDFLKGEYNFPILMFLLKGGGAVLLLIAVVLLIYDRLSSGRTNCSSITR